MPSAGFSAQHGAFVFGLEGDISFSEIGQTDVQDLSDFSVIWAHDINWLATLRARAGYAWENSLVYVTGGAAFAEFELGMGIVDVPGLWAADSETYTGFAVGAGYEHSLGQNWSIKLDYLYAGFDKEVSMLGTATKGADSISFVTDGAGIDNLHIFRAGVNYRF